MRPVALPSGVSRAAHSASNVATGLLVLALRLIALVVYMLMALAEPFIATILGFLALGCFSVSVLFGFILHAPFHQRWFALGASVVFLGVYLLYRFLMQGVERLLG